MPYALIEFYWYTGFPKTPNILFFESREDAVLACRCQLFSDETFRLNPEYHHTIVNHLGSPDHKGLIKSSNTSLSIFWVRECENTVDAVLSLLSLDLELFDTESRGVNEAIDVNRLLGI